MKAAFEIHIEAYTDEVRSFTDVYHVIASNQNLAVIALMNRLIEEHKTITAITKIEEVESDIFDGVFPIDFNVVNGD